MNLLAGKFLIDKNGASIPVEEILQGTKLILLYFAAAWCPYSILFVETLRAVHEEAMKFELPIQVIYVSADNNETEMLQHFSESHGHWYAVKYDDDVRPLLRMKYGITSIPVLLVVRPDGYVVSKNGRRQVEDYGVNVFLKWM
ncbi:nucleoredoxin-like protein 2 [Schistocerca gregaria]|uniref:nucleoredoxin-like protein 2 n=1 Tax=Schistocerca gregaria TaxID=7010 RepID=UPI00211ED681|nr:nucleoredoxin-like protein 2 [Schistocerca gregaria]